MENCQDLSLKFLSARGAVQALDKDALFESVLSLLQNPERALKMAENARRLAESEHDVLKHIMTDILPYFPFLTNEHLFTHEYGKKNA